MRPAATDDCPALLLPRGTRYATVAAGFAREAALAAGFPPDSAERLALLAEEVAAVAAPRTAIALRIEDRRAALQLSTVLPPDAIDTGLLDAAHSFDPESEQALTGLGVYLLGRLADALMLTSNDDGSLALRLVVERPYAATANTPPATPPGAAVRVVDPDDATLLRLAHAAADPGEAWRIPARLVDRRAAGDISVRVALDAQDRPVAGLLWQRESAALVRLDGPVLALGATQPAQAASLLVDAALAALARSGAVALIALDAPSYFPADGFETVGAIAGRPVLYRALEEDPGGAAWVPERLRPFYETARTRLALGRDVLPSTLAGSLPAGGAAMAAHVERGSSRVTLRPLHEAADAARVAAANVALFRAQGLADIRAVLDLGRPGHGVFADGLLDAGLRPAALLPDPAGDLLVFEATA